MQISKGLKYTDINDVQQKVWLEYDVVPCASDDMAYTLDIGYIILCPDALKQRTVLGDRTKDRAGVERYDIDSLGERLSTILFHELLHAMFFTSSKSTILMACLFLSYAVGLD